MNAEFYLFVKLDPRNNFRKLKILRNALQLNSLFSLIY